MNPTLSASTQRLGMTACLIAGALLFATGCTSTSPLPPGVTFSTKEQVFATSGKIVDVFSVPAGTASVALTASVGGFTDAHRIAFDAAGNLYVSDSSANLIDVYPPSAYAPGSTGSPAPSLTIGGTAMTGPFGMAFDSKGYLYVANSGGNVVILAPITVPSTSTTVAITPAPYIVISGSATGLSSPNGLALDQAGNVYVADEGNASVAIFSASDIAAAVTPPPTMDGPSPAISLDTIANIAPSTTITGFTSMHSLTLDAAGNLYVTDQGGVSNAPALSIAAPLASAPTVSVPPRVDIFSAAQVATKQGIVSPAAKVYIPGMGVTGSLTTLSHPNGIAVDSLGDIYVADKDLSEILIYPAVTLGTGTGVEDNVAPVATITVPGSVSLHDVAVRNPLLTVK